MRSTYAAAVERYPFLKDAIETITQYPIAHWYTDRDPYAEKNLIEYMEDSHLHKPKGSCNSIWSRKVIVIYGIPNKDCEGHFSSDGSNKTKKAYEEFLLTLVRIVHDKPVLLIIEPDAVGNLISAPDHAKRLGYADNVKFAIHLLSSKAPHCELYLDVGYWTLCTDKQAKSVMKLLSSLDKKKKCKGIVLNTSNYRSNEEMNSLCERLRRISGRDYSCIVDTSRNYLPPPASNEWCNVKRAGIGIPPTSCTGLPCIDHFVWIKPPGESDGEGTGRSSDSMLGPPAGEFFVEHFVTLWNNGYFVAEKGASKLDMNDMKSCSNSK